MMLGERRRSCLWAERRVPSGVQQREESWKDYGVHLEGQSGRMVRLPGAHPLHRGSGGAAGGACSGNRPAANLFHRCRGRPVDPVRHAGETFAAHRHGMAGERRARRVSHRQSGESSGAEQDRLRAADPLPCGSHRGRAPAGGENSRRNVYRPWAPARARRRPNGRRLRGLSKGAGNGEVQPHRRQTRRPAAD
jgi:hypothetical protein